VGDLTRSDSISPMQLIMFDIDGTLVDSDEFDGPLYAQAVRSVTGEKVDTTWGSYRNVTDSGILLELLERRGLHQQADEIAKRVMQEFFALTDDYLKRHPSVIREVSGARILVEALRAKPNVRVAVATGGWRETAFLKLNRIGLDPQSLPIATACDAIERTRIMQIAEERASVGEVPDRRIYFGDGTWDKRACAELNYDFIAVGRKVEHLTRFDDLSQITAILEQLRV
jgi:phosphoglycolate phosphatase-like HAD superfamily hydrolase